MQGGDFGSINAGSKLNTNSGINILVKNATFDEINETIKSPSSTGTLVEINVILEDLETINIKSLSNINKVKIINSKDNY